MLINLKKKNRNLSFDDNLDGAREILFKGIQPVEIEIIILSVKHISLTIDITLFSRTLS